MSITCGDVKYSREQLAHFGIELDTTDFTNEQICKMMKNWLDISDLINFANQAETQLLDLHIEEDYVKSPDLSDKKANIRLENGNIHNVNRLVEHMLYKHDKNRDPYGGKIWSNDSELRFILLHPALKSELKESFEQEIKQYK
jgi:hypothetical protein